ncbi:MAG TPA: hypothetical protein VF384_03810 [Planctomycetota bacterium]
MQRSSSLLLAVALATTATAQLTLVTPNGYANTVGNSNNIYPWGRDTASMRIQFLIDSSHFTNQGVSSPITIQQLRYRPWAGSVTSWSGGTWPSVRIDMATSPQDWALASTVFANNLGPDLTTVLNGPVTMNGGSTLGPGVVVPWYITIPLTTPFLYDPTSGNDLTIDIYLNGAGWSGTSRGADFVQGTPGTGAAGGCRVYDTSGITGSSGTITTAYAPITEFTYVPAAGYASAAPYGTGCINVPDVSTYELFGTSAAFDLDNTSMSLVPTGTGYLAVPGLTSFVPPSGTATTLSLGDDTETTVTLSAPMPIGSTSTTQLTVCSNGFVSAGTGNGTAYTPDPTVFLNGPRAWWSLVWHDLNPAIVGSGQVKFEEVGGVAYVTWDGVWDYGGTSVANANTFQAQFDIATGLVHYVWQTVSNSGNGILTGISNAGPSPNPGSMDISAALPSTYIASTFATLPLALASSARPVIGTSISLNSTQVPPAGLVGLQILGLTEFTAGIDLTFLGMPGCNLHTTLDATATFFPVGGTGSSPFAIPGLPALAGTVIRTQSAVWVPGINAFGFITSNGVRLTLDMN